MIFDIFKAARVRVAGIIVENNKILLIAHKKGKKIYWLLPGGGVLFGESLVQALERELKEELNISVDINDIAILCDSIDINGKRHIINVCFNCRSRNGSIKLGKEKRLYDFGFFGENELDSLIIYPPLRKELQDILKGTRMKSRYLGTRWINQ